MKRKTAWFLGAVVVAACIVLAPSPVSADLCYFYPNSQKEFWGGYGFICAGYNPAGCTECVNAQGGSCVRDGLEACRPRNQIFARHQESDVTTHGSLDAAPVSRLNARHRVDKGARQI